MVDTLLSAAVAESDSSLDDIIMSGRNDEFINSDDQPPLRFCEFCNSSNTPTWRRGPAGKGSLCNACGIKWRLRKRMKKNEKGDSPSPTSTPDKDNKPSPKPQKKRKERDSTPKSPRKLLNPPPLSSELLPLPSPSKKENKRKKYYCKYCDRTFSLSQFRNSQQFGAHCSNCSRRPPRFGDDNPYDGGYSYNYHQQYNRYSTTTTTPGHYPLSSPESPLPQPPQSRDGLLMRLLHVVEHQLVDLHELEEIRGELNELKTELISREEASKAELSSLRVRFHEELEDMKGMFKDSVAAHEQQAAHRLMEMEQTIKRGSSLL